MNDITNVQTMSDELLAQAAPVLNPEKYSAAVFEPFRKQLLKAKREAAKIDSYDIVTNSGMATAKSLRASFRDIRTSAENARKDRKAPIIQIGKLIDAKYKELEAEIRPLEDKYDSEIKAEEAAREAEKARKLAEERARVEAIEARVANIRGVPAQMANADSTAIRKQIDQWTLLRLEPADYQEYLESALTAVNTTLDQLGVLLAGAEAREAEARRVAEERIELARLKAERAEIEAKAAAEAAEREAKAVAEEAERKRLAQNEREAAARREAQMAAEMEEMRRELAASRAAAAAAAAPAPAPAPAPAAPDVAEEDGAGLIAGPIVMIGDTVPTGDLAGIERISAPYKAAGGAEKIMKRPEFGEVVEVLATHYGTSEETVIVWFNSYCAGM